MTTTTGIAVVCQNFGRDIDGNLAAIGARIDEARSLGVDLLVFPEACIGGYLSVLGRGRDGSHDERPESLPPITDLDGPELRAIAQMAGDMTVVVGLCEQDQGTRYNSAVALSGDGVLGVHRKVHQPLGEGLFYSAGEQMQAFDTAVGRLGLLICYDKAFPESARTLAVDGAEIIACISAWPGSRTSSAADIAADRWTQRFTLFDQARALENQVVWAASNQHGTFGSLRFVANAKIVGPGGDIRATTGTDDGMAVAHLDVAQELELARRSMFHLGDRRPELYGALTRTGTPAEAESLTAGAEPVLAHGSAR